MIREEIRRYSMLQTTMMVAGGIMTAVALAADWIGLGDPGFDTGQMLLASAGLVILLAGMLPQQWSAAGGLRDCGMGWMASA